jgi:hypothetical protein
VQKLEADEYNLGLPDTSANENTSSASPILSDIGASGTSDPHPTNTPCTYDYCTVGSVMLVSEGQALVSFLKMLHSYTRMFGLHPHRELKQKTSIDKSCDILATTLDFLRGHVEEIKAMYHLERVRQGPEGAMTSPVLKDVELQLHSLRFLSQLITKINPEYDITMEALTTLMTENLFSEMRQTIPMPLVHQFAIRFSYCMRETLKRLTTKTFHY